MMSTATTVGLASSAAIASSSVGLSRPSLLYPCVVDKKLSTSCSSSALQLSLSSRRRERRICCEVALKPDSETSALSELEREKEAADAKIGARVRVKVPLKVYHIPKVPVVDLTGKEGKIKQYVGVWKGKRISANLPYKVEFFTNVEGGGQVKFLAHLKEDEFEYL